MGKSIIVINKTDDDKEDLMKDLISIIHSLQECMVLEEKKINKKLLNF